MNNQIYNILNNICLKINQKNDFEIFNLNFEIYSKLIEYLNQYQYQNIGFFRKKNDCIDYYAIMDELIKNQKNVFQIENNINSLSISTVKKITNFILKNDGIYSYPKTNVSYLNKLSIIIYPVQIVKNNLCYIYTENELNFLKKFKGIKIAIGYKESITNKNIETLKKSFIKFDKIILV